MALISPIPAPCATVGSALQPGIARDALPRCLAQFLDLALQQTVASAANARSHNTRAWLAKPQRRAGGFSPPCTAGSALAAAARWPNNASVLCSPRQAMNSMRIANSSQHHRIQPIVLAPLHPGLCEMPHRARVRHHQLDPRLRA